MIRVYLGLGSNLNSPQRQLRQALESIRALAQTYLVDTAEFMHNKAWGREKQPDFYNTVAAIDTRLTPFTLLKQCKRIERQHGRATRVKWGARTIDIDILLYGDRVINAPELKIPHPYILQREFVYKPLQEIAPDLKIFAKVKDKVTSSRHPTQ